GSETNWNPASLDDHSIVAPVRTNLPVKPSISLVTVARSMTPPHSMSNETVAGTGATGGRGGFERPFPILSALPISCASITSTLVMRSDAVPFPGCPDLRRCLRLPARPAVHVPCKSVASTRGRYQPCSLCLPDRFLEHQKETTRPS